MKGWIVWRYVGNWTGARICSGLFRKRHSHELANGSLRALAESGAHRSEIGWTVLRYDGLYAARYFRPSSGAIETYFLIRGRREHRETPARGGSRYANSIRIDPILPRVGAQIPDRARAVFDVGRHHHSGQWHYRVNTGLTSFKSVNARPFPIRPYIVRRRTCSTR